MDLHYPQKSNGLYILSRNQIDDIATMALREYMPAVLEYPQPVDIEKIVEDRLFLTVQSRMLSLSGSILGMTVFEDTQAIPCLDERLCSTQIDLPAGTVLIHTSLFERENVKRRRYTLAHEGAH